MPAKRVTQTLDHAIPPQVVALRPGRMALGICAMGHERRVEFERPYLRIGAAAGNDVVIDDPSVSARHCELRVGAGGGTLRDCESKNGTWYEGASIQQAWLKVGQAFRVGACRIRLLAVRDVEVTMSPLDHFGSVRGVGPTMGEMFDKLTRVTACPLDVLLVGELGTGKELIATNIHQRSTRRDGPLVKVDCRELDANASAQLFGSPQQPGCLEVAEGGTLVLSDVTAMPLGVQKRLSRCLEARKVLRGGLERCLDLRVISTAREDLDPMIDRGSFCRELLYRMASVRIDVPPLRHRGEGNIPLLTDLFVEEIARQTGRPLRLERSAYLLLEQHGWPGNVTELERALLTAAAMARGDTIGQEDIHLLGEQGLAVVPSDEASRFAQEARACLNMSWKPAWRRFGQLYASYQIGLNGGSHLRAASQAGVHRNTLRKLLSGEEET